MPKPLAQWMMFALRPEETKAIEAWGTPSVNDRPELVDAAAVRGHLESLPPTGGRDRVITRTAAFSFTRPRGGTSPARVAR